MIGRLLIALLLLCAPAWGQTAGPSFVSTSTLAIGGALQAGSTFTVRGTSYSIGGYTDPTTDSLINNVNGSVSYTSNATGGDTVTQASTMVVNANGHTVNVPQHIAGAYNSCSLATSGTVTWCNGAVAGSGNGGTGTVTNAVDFRGHTDFNTGGGTLTNHYFLYEEGTTAATNEYGAYFTAAIGIGPSAPTYNIDMSAGFVGGLSASNWMRLGTGNGTLLVTNGGTSVYPASNNGAGSFSADYIVVGQSFLSTNVKSGELGLSKITASGAAPGATGMKIAGVCGTNAGSMKIIAYAGTSTTPVTVIDNVGSGVSGC